MFSSKRTIRTISIPRLWKFIAAFGRYRAKNTQKNTQALKFWPFLAILGVKNFIQSNKIFGDHLVHMETQLQTKIRTRHSMIGSPDRFKIKRSSIQKLGRFIAAFGSYRSKTHKTVNFGQKWQSFSLKLPKFCQKRIFQAYRVCFPQRRP